MLQLHSSLLPILLVLALCASTSLAVERDPSYDQIDTEIDRIADQHGVPPIIIKAICFKESSWRQFGPPESPEWEKYRDKMNDPTGKVKFRPEFDDRGNLVKVGYGLMQVTLPPDDDRVPKLCQDWKYNIHEGARILVKKKWPPNWPPHGKAPEGANLILENWYYPIAWYNGSGKKAYNYVKTVLALFPNPPAVGGKKYWQPVRVLRPEETSGHKAFNDRTIKGEGQKNQPYDLSWFSVIHKWNERIGPQASYDALPSAHALSPRAAPSTVPAAGLRDTIDRRLEALPAYPEYIHGQGGLADAVLEVGARKRIEEYGRWYGVAVDYRGLAEVELLRAKRLLNCGELDAARKHVENSGRYVKQSHLANQAAITCYQAGIEQANLKAEVVYKSSRAAFVFVSGAAGLGPFATVIADHVYTATDFAVNWKQSGLTHATKQAVIDVVSREIGNAILREVGAVLPKDVKGESVTSKVSDVLKKLATDPEFSQRIVALVSQKTTEEVTSSLVSKILAHILSASGETALSRASQMPSRPSAQDGHFFLSQVHAYWQQHREEAPRIPEALEGADPEVARHNSRHPAYSCHSSAEYGEARRQCKVFVRYVLDRAGLEDVPDDSQAGQPWPSPWEDVAIKNAAKVLKDARRGDVFWFEFAPGVGHWGFVWDSSRTSITVFDANREGFVPSKAETHGRLGEAVWDTRSALWGRKVLENLRLYRQQGLAKEEPPPEKPREQEHPPPDFQEVSPVAACLIIDRSGSMGLGMPWHTGVRRIEAAREAASLFGSLLAQNDSVALVSFSNSATVDLKSGAFGDGAPFRQSVASLTPGGTTNIGDGIARMAEQLQASGNLKKLALLLSDGAHNTGKGPLEVIDAGAEFFGNDNCRIFTVGIGSGHEFDEKLLEEIAARTGGEYEHCLFPGLLSCRFADWLERGGRQNTVYCKISGLVQHGAEALRTLWLNPPPVARFLTTWDEGNLEVELITPGGVAMSPSVAAANDDIWFARGEHHALYTVRNPAAGEWRVRLTAVEAPRKGARYYVLVSGSKPIETNVVETRQFYPPGDLVKLKVAVRRKASASGDWVVRGGLPVEVIARVTGPAGKTEKVTLYDDGKHSDGQPRDGVFGGVIKNTSAEGDYEAKIDIRGPVNRTIVWGFCVDKRAGPGAAGLDDGAREIPWRKMELTVLGITQKLASVTATDRLALRHQASGYSRTLSGSFLVFTFTLTNDADGPVRLARRKGPAGRFGSQPALVEVTLKDDKIEFHHHCLDASGRPQQPEDLSGYAPSGEVEDGTPIDKDRTVSYSLVYSVPAALRSDVKYLVETYYQTEIAGRLRTSVPWSDVQPSARR